MRGESFLLRQDDQPALHLCMAGAAVFGASDVERTCLVSHELHGGRLASLRDQSFHTERFDREAVSDGPRSGGGAGRGPPAQP